MEAALKPPSWQEIASEVRPWWEWLSVLDRDGSLLRAVSYMAEQYLVFTTQAFVQDEGPRPEISLGDVVPDQLWLMVYRLELPPLASSGALSTRTTTRWL